MRIRALSAVLVLVCSASMQAQLTRTRSLVSLQSVGKGGIEVGDFDSDGLPEIVLAGPDTWLVLERSFDGYRLDWAGPSYPIGAGGDLAGIASADVGGDGRPELFVANQFDRVIEIWDLSARALVGEIQAPGGAFEGVAAGDIDDDGSVEVVLLRQATSPPFFRIQVFGAQSGAMEREVGRPDEGGPVLLAEIDGDAPLEILVGFQGGALNAYDGLTLSVDWSHSGTLFGGNPGAGVGDFDGDGLDEIVALDWGESWVTALDPGDPSGQLWQLPADTSTSGVFDAADIDGDLDDEIVEGRRDEVAVLEGTNGSLIGLMPKPFDVVARVALADTSGDGALDVVFANESPVLFCDEAPMGIGPIASLQFDWLADPRQGFVGLSAGLPAAGSGAPDLIYATSCWDAPGSDQARAVIRSGLTWLASAAHQLPWASGSVEEVLFHEVGQGDADVQLEHFALLSDGSSNKWLVGVDAATGDVEWEIPYSGPFRSAMRVADVVGDDADEILFAFNDFSGRGIEARSGLDASLLWTTEPVTGFSFAPEFLLAAQLDGNPETEVLGAEYDGIAIFSGTDGSKVREILVSGLTSIGLSEAGGGPTVDLLVGLSNGELRSVDPRTGVVSSPIVDLGSQSIVAVSAVSDLRGAGTRDAIVIAGDRLHIVDLTLQSVVWESDPWASPAGPVRLLIADADADGDDDVLVGSGGRIDLYETGSGLLFADGFETGNLSRWSSAQ